MVDFTLLKIIPVANTLGECILWDTHSQSVWWTDIHGACLYRYHLASAALKTWPLPQRLCSFGFVEQSALLVCAFDSGIALYDVDTGKTDWLYRPELDCTGTRFNDGRVDRQGRFWSGTMVEAAAATNAKGEPVSGSLYWVSGSSSGKTLEGIRISNSLCWSVDGRTAYFADSPSGLIHQYAFDPGTAAFSNKRVFAALPVGSAPDGSIIDAEGFLWNAQWGGGRVVRYFPGGDTHSVLELPVSQPTCICLGGPDLNLLFVSTARENLTPEQLQQQPHAGHVFVYQTNCTGVAESRFARN